MFSQETTATPFKKDASIDKKKSSNVVFFCDSLKSSLTEKEIGHILEM